MNRIIHPIVLVALWLSLFSIGLSAQPAHADDDPRITSFSTTATNVNRTELFNGTARIPVSWETADRPIFATLLFEQVLPDGSSINIELPRSTPWVNSSGSGVVAPRPVGNASEITIRVRLYSFWLNREYDVQQLTLPIVNERNNPVIQRFETEVTTISRSDLINRSVYIPVSFGVAWRTNTQNLVFEQVMPDGSLQNVELPRSNPIVASAGDGNMRPFDPGQSADVVRFRLTVYDLRNGARLTSSEFTIAIDETAPPTGNSFTVVSTDIVEGGTVLLSWSVSNTSGVYLSYQTAYSGEQQVTESLLPAVASNYTAPVPNGVQLITFLLRDANGNPFASNLSETVGVTCNQDLLYNVFIDYCPNTAILSTDAAYQLFQNGYMLWFDDRVFVFYKDGTGVWFNDSYSAADDALIAEATADVPDGFAPPLRGFGKVWAINEDVRTRLGWGLSLIEVYSMDYQLAAIDAYSRWYTAALPTGTLIGFQQVDYQYVAGTLNHQ